MAKTKLFDNWTWNRKLPEPFESLPNHSSTTIFSKYCETSKKKSTMHSATLSAILAFMEIDSTGTTPVDPKGAIGSQGNDFSIAEYPSHTGNTHVVVFNHKNGKFTAGKYVNETSSPSPYVLKESEDSGSALFFSLIPQAMMDDEFAEEYAKLLLQKHSGFPDEDKTTEAALILCDNFYRRISNADNLGNAGIKTSIPSTGNIGMLTQLSMNKGTYSPTNTIFGEFKILKPGNAPKSTFSVTKEDFEGKYALSERTLTSKENRLVPSLPSWYVIPQEVVTICEHAKKTSNGVQPMRNFMLRGNAGTGKTESAKAVAAGLGLPYVHITCSANSEIYDFLGQILPDMDNNNNPVTIYPSLEDIQMDPSSAYFKLTGEYNEDITESEVYDKLIEVIEKNTENPKEQKQKFKYVDTQLIKGIRNGYVVEIQEPSIIANPGVLVGLNSLLDRCSSIALPTGEVIQRHPDTVIIITTNNDYAGCKDMNQSVISRMNLVMDVEEPDIDTLVKRVSGITGCTDTSVIKNMAEVVKNISERCRETMITDGCCGVRELISWVQSYMICNNALDAAKYTVLASVSNDAENRAEICTSCLEPVFAA